MLAKVTRFDKSLTTVSNGISWIEVLVRCPLLPPWQVGGNGIPGLGLIPLGRSYLSACRSVPCWDQRLRERRYNSSPKICAQITQFCIWRHADYHCSWRDLIRCQGRDGAEGSGRSRYGTRMALISSHTAWGIYSPSGSLRKSWDVLESYLAYDMDFLRGITFKRERSIQTNLHPLERQTGKVANLAIIGT